MNIPFKWDKSAGYTYREKSGRKFTTFDYDWISSKYKFDSECYLVKEFKDFYDAYTRIRIFFEGNSRCAWFQSGFNSCAVVRCLNVDAPRIKKMLDKLMQNRGLWQLTASPVK